jgi:hypothetical protein
MRVNQKSNLNNVFRKANLTCNTDAKRFVGDALADLVQNGHKAVFVQISFNLQILNLSRIKLLELSLKLQIKTLQQFLYSPFHESELLGL